MTPPALESVNPRIVALSGGIGGAKLAFGLAQILAPEDLLVVVNTGDDFEHMGLTICPDIDTVVYTLARLNNPELGWGRRDERWSVHETLSTLGVDNWFQLGDRDLALHLARRQLLDSGCSLSQATTRIAQRLGVAHRIAPMSDQPVRTLLDTGQGRLTFQEYFVRERCEPALQAVSFAGAAEAQPAAALLSALASDRLEAIILCPSNPVLSIDPILSVTGLRGLLQQSAVPVIAVSPIIAGAAVKGPTSKILSELGLDCSALTCARRYADFLDAYLLDRTDQNLAGEAGKIVARVSTAQTLMTSDSEKSALARVLLALVAELRGESPALPAAARAPR